MLFKTSVIGRGGQSLIAKELHVGRDTIRKGIEELDRPVPVIDNHHAKGRKKVQF